MNNTIHLAGAFRHAELPADEVITPGMLLTRTATGVAKHATAGGVSTKSFAQEDALQGRTTADTYAVGDPVMINHEQTGSLTNALLLAGSHYTIGTKLISDGAGRLKPTTGTPAETVAIAEEDVDLSASGAVDTLGKVKVL